jgi:hypothetical protein
MQYPHQIRSSALPYRRYKELEELLGEAVLVLRPARFILGDLRSQIAKQNSMSAFVLLAAKGPATADNGRTNSIACRRADP